MLSPDRGSGVGRSQSRYGEMIINGERMRWRWQVVQGLPFTPAWSPVSGRRHAAESRRIRAARTALPAGRDLEDLDLDLDRYPAARHACARLNPASKGQSAEQHPAGCSAFWFSINRRGGSVLLHHRHIRPVLIREWSPPMDGIPATIWASRTTSDLTSATPLARMRRATPRLAASHRPTGSGQTRERTGIALGPAPFLSAGSPQTRARSRAVAGADQRNIRRSAGTGTTGLRTRSAARAAGPQP